MAGECREGCRWHYASDKYGRKPLFVGVMQCKAAACEQICARLRFPTKHNPGGRSSCDAGGVVGILQNRETYRRNRPSSSHHPPPASRELRPPGLRFAGNFEAEQYWRLGKAPRKVGKVIHSVCECGPKLCDRGHKLCNRGDEPCARGDKPCERLYRPCRLVHRPCERLFRLRETRALPEPKTRSRS